MRAQRFLALSAVAGLVALTAWTRLDPISTGVFAQGPPGQGGRGAAPAAGGDAVPHRRSWVLRTASSR